MQKKFRFIDSDAHILEPNDMFERYLDPKFRHQMPKTWLFYDGDPLGFRFELSIPNPDGGSYTMPFGRDPIDSSVMGPASFDPGVRVSLPGQDEAYAEFAKQNFPPEMYPVAMERTGIDYMVVYPSVGLLSVAVPKMAADTAAAYRRAYNDWLYDFCSAAGGRVFGSPGSGAITAQRACVE